jgi:ABC-type multidrug transport system fused ATPase/permease subunit
MQKIIREEFEGATILTIAHRISTIADYDKVIVMSDGELVEFGTPHALLQKPGGVFNGMVVALGAEEERGIRQVAATCEKNKSNAKASG